MKPEQVVAIDISLAELEEAPTGFLRIVMDAADLKFPDRTFRTVTAFFSLMFMKPEIHKKVLVEAYRVLQSGGRWLIWDASIPARPVTPSRRFMIDLHTKLPKETIDYGYSILWPERPMDVGYYRALAEQAGFQVAELETHGGDQKTLYMELRKP